MKILAVEFSSQHRSVAIAEVSADGKVVVRSTTWEVQTPQTKALTMVEAALAKTQVTRASIECIAVGLGPGSYTGIRASISLAQGWQLARGIKLIGVSSVECLAAQAQSEGLRGPVSFVIDAQRNEFYLARYEISADGTHVTEALRLATREEVQKRLDAGEALLGPEAAQWFPKARDRFPDAATLAKLAVQRHEYVSGDKLEPIYLREVSFVKAPPPRSLAGL